MYLSMQLEEAGQDACPGKLEALRSNNTPFRSGYIRHILNIVCLLFFISLFMLDVSIPSFAAGPSGSIQKSCSSAGKVIKLSIASSKDKNLAGNGKIVNAARMTALAASVEAAPKKAPAAVKKTPPQAKPVPCVTPTPVPTPSQVISPAPAQTIPSCPSPDRPMKTLDDCILRALDIHPELKSALALQEAARARVTQARAGFFPRISFVSQYNRSVSTTEIAPVVPDPLDPTSAAIPVTVSQNVFTNTLNLTQNIFDFGRTHFQVLSASENLNAAHYELLTNLEQVIFDVRQAYFLAVAAERSVDVNRQAVAQQELHLRQAQGFFEIGRRSRIEVVKAEVDLANARLGLLEAENNEKLSKAKLANSMGMTGPSNCALNESAQVLELDMTFDESLEYAKAHRPELLRLCAQERASAALVGFARAQYYPTITGNANYGYQNEQFTFRLPAWGWGVRLNFDLFTGGLRSGQVKEAQCNLASIHQQRIRLWQNIYLEIEQTFLDLNLAKNQIAVLEKSLAQAREAFTLAQGRYEVGLGDNLEFSDARVALTRAENDLIGAVLNYQIARARLERAVGVSILSNDLLRNCNAYKDNINFPNTGEKNNGQK